MVRAFNYEAIAADLLEPDIVSTLGQIYWLRHRLGVQIDLNSVPLRPSSQSVAAITMQLGGRLLTPYSYRACLCST